MRYFFVKAGTLGSTAAPPPAMLRLSEQPVGLLPPLISELHRSFAAWGDAGYSPGPVIPTRIWFDPHGNLAFEANDFDAAKASAVMPPRLMQVGLAPDLAAWLVLLGKWMETFVVIARARSVWSVDELAGAITFASPAYLPAGLLALPPDNWLTVTQALAAAIADGPLRGEAQNRHWQEKR